jgi:hypothetical protein
MRTAFVDAIVNPALTLRHILFEALSSRGAIRPIFWWWFVGSWVGLGLVIRWSAAEYK